MTLRRPRRLQRLTRPFILRRLKTDPKIIDDLPDKNEMKVFCNLTKEQASLYAAVVEEAARDLEGADGIQRKGVILGVLSKLKQVCNHPAQFLADNSPIPNRSGKLARLTEMVEEILAGQRPGTDLYPVCRDGQDPAAPPAGNLRPGSALPARRDPQKSSGMRWWSASRQTAAACPCSFCP